MERKKNQPAAARLGLQRMALLAAVLLAAAAALPLSGCTAFKKAEAVKEMEVETPAIERVADGTYLGRYDAGFTKVDLETTVRNGSITEITILRHENGKGEKAERIVDDIIREQSLEVDVVAGATVSSKTILKATEISLLRGLE